MVGIWVLSTINIIYFSRITFLMVSRFGEQFYYSIKYLSLVSLDNRTELILSRFCRLAHMRYSLNESSLFKGERVGGKKDPFVRVVCSPFRRGCLNRLICIASFFALLSGSWLAC